MRHNEGGNTQKINLKFFVNIADPAHNTAVSTFIRPLSLPETCQHLDFLVHEIVIIILHNFPSPTDTK